MNTIPRKFNTTRMIHSEIHNLSVHRNETKCVSFHIFSLKQSQRKRFFITNATICSQKYEKRHEFQLLILFSINLEKSDKRDLQIVLTKMA